MRRMEAEGHQVGNHTWNHVTLSGDLTADLEELQRTDALLQEILGPGTYWIRPPYGLISEASGRPFRSRWSTGQWIRRIGQSSPRRLWSRR